MGREGRSQLAVQSSIRSGFWSSIIIIILPSHHHHHDNSIFYHTHHQQVKTIVNIIRLLAIFPLKKVGEPNGVFIVIIPSRKGMISVMNSSCLHFRGTPLSIAASLRGCRRRISSSKQGRD